MDNFHYFNSGYKLTKRRGYYEHNKNRRKKSNRVRGRN